MKHSIRVKFTLLFVGITAASILVCILINQSFLERYYINDKKNILEAAYNGLEEIMAQAQSDSTELRLETTLGELSDSNNLSVVIRGSDGIVRASSAREVRKLLTQLLNYVFHGPVGEEILEQTDRYQILRSYDAEQGGEDLVCWGVFEDGSAVIMSIPIAGIRDSVGIANRFYVYVGVGSVLVCAILLFFVTRKMTKPILSLAEISEKMAQLDFDVHYRGKEKNEIGILGNSMNHLSDKLRETISELKDANVQLQKDIEEKIQIDDMRKEFLSNVSHELKTPLALIQGYAEGLKDCVNDDADSRDFYCDVIMDEAAKMNKMVKKLLTLNQLEFGNNMLQLENFDLSEVIQGSLQSLKVLAEQKNTEIVWERREPLFVYADEFMIEEVVNNYVSNALNHVGEKDRIVIRTEKREGNIRVTVWNGGSHIPEEDLDKVWIKFFKVDKARTREYGGSGIGLSIVKAIMESHKGGYGVYNTEDGVAFWFELKEAKQEIDQ